jgi:hypothetical protein
VGPGLGAPQGWSRLVQKISPPPGFDPWTVQPIASRYTDCAIAAHTLYYTYAETSLLFAQGDELWHTVITASGSKSFEHAKAACKIKPADF